MLKFIEEYRIYNYNIKLASRELLEKFNISELKTFIEILSKNDNNENILNLLSGYQDVLDEKVGSRLKFLYLKDSYYILFSIVLFLVITFITVIYPIFKQVLNGLGVIFN